MSVRVPEAVALPPSPGSLGAPSTSQRSSAENGTNQANGADQVLAWMYTRGEYSRLRQRAKSRTAVSAWSAENAARVSDGAADRSRDSTSQDRSLVCQGQM